ncbi:hypothetical protein LEMLEM_LOCUS6458 [Lemmus lemmus]
MFLSRQPQQNSGTTLGSEKEGDRDPGLLDPRWWKESL